MGAARHPAPLDELTRLPLLPNYRHGERPIGGELSPVLRSDLHHGYFEEDTFKRTEHGKKTRQSWGIITPRWAHDRYHEVVLPLSPETDVRAWVWALIAAEAGYIPPKGIALPQKGEYEIVDLSAERRAQLRGKHGIHVPNPDLVRRGILEWVIETGFGAQLGEIEDFAYTDDVAVMEVYGETFIKEASMVATEPLGEVYAHAYESGCLPARVPQAIGECVFRMLAKKECNQTNMQTIGWLRTVLRRQLEQAEPILEMAAIA